MCRPGPAQMSPLSSFGIQAIPKRARNRKYALRRVICVAGGTMTTGGSRGTFRGRQHCGLYDRVCATIELVALVPGMNFILPFGRSGMCKGNVSGAPVWVGYRLPAPGWGIGRCHPFVRDSAVNISLTYEAGYRCGWGTVTPPRTTACRRTYEGRIHFPVRADTLKRNLMEPAEDSPWAMWCMVIGREVGPMGSAPVQLKFSKGTDGTFKPAPMPCWLQDCHSSKATNTVC